MTLKAPFPWFGGKSRAAHLVWRGFGDVANYVEPFAGSLAVLLGRPAAHFAERTPIETVNDLDCYLANFWRAVKWAPELVAEHADWPVNEADLHARHRDLVARVEFRKRMKREARFFDAEIAGWWVWGLCQWIGGGWCAASNWEANAKRPRGIHTAEEARRPNLHTANGVHRRQIETAAVEGRPHLLRGKGVHQRQIPEKLPLIGGTRGTGVHRRSLGRSNGSVEWEGRGAGGDRAGVGVHKRSLSEQLPSISGLRGASGRGIHGTGESQGPLVGWMQDLADRLRRVRVCCGNWSRVLGRSSTESIGLTGIVLDPPYLASAGRDPSLYSTEDVTVATDVRAWALEHGSNPKLRIALCGYEGEHDMPKSWECVEWKAAGGYAAAAGNHENAHRERIWFSPHCELVELQGDLFREVANG